MKSTILIQAPVFSRSGYGEHGRKLIFALFKSQKYNMIVAPSGWGGSSTTDNLTKSEISILEYCCNNTLRQGVEFTYIHVGIPTEFKKVGIKNIGITAGVETNIAPKEWTDPCNAMDALIVPTEFTKMQLEAIGITVPIYCITEGIDTSIFTPRSDEDLVLGNIGDFLTPFNFLSVGQWIGMDPMRDRKGVGFLIAWFCEAFKDNSDVGLVIKTYMNNISSPDFIYTRDQIRALKGNKVSPKIYLIHGDMTEQEMVGLYKHPQIKAFVTTTSGEGYGLGIAQAAAVNLPILATGWSAHTTYLHSDLYTAFKYSLVDIPSSAYQPALLYPPMKWALADKEDVIHKMKRCYCKYEVAVEKAQKQGDYFRLKHTKEHSDAALISAIEEILTGSSSVQQQGIILPFKGVTV